MKVTINLLDLSRTTIKRRLVRVRLWDATGFFFLIQERFFIVTGNYYRNADEFQLFNCGLFANLTHLLFRI